MTSLWLDRNQQSTYPTLTPGRRFDCVVVGGGLTGITTALLVARSGLSVAVLEGRSVGSVATGNTTAKLSLLQGSRLSKISGKHSKRTTRKYVEANREGQRWLLRYCEEHGIAVQRERAYTYATTESGAKTAKSEFSACRDAGLDVQWCDELPELPFETKGAVALDDQAQFDPIEVLSALAEDARAHGAEIFEDTRVQKVSRGSGGGGSHVIETTRGDVEGTTVVLATGTPILDRGGFFARLEPLRSYCVSFRVPNAIPRGMYLSADQPSRSLRYAPSADGDLLLVGGNGHPVGRKKHTAEVVDDLVKWTQQYFPGAEPTHAWSAQDYEAIDELPFVGSLLPGQDDILVATGYAKWGMTNAVSAALAISGRIAGGGPPWADVFESWRPAQLGGIPKAVQLNGGVAVHMTGGWLRLAISRDGQRPEEGHGQVHRSPIRPVATCTVDAKTHRVSGICPHLGGIVSWNEAERSWDCPLHGSRFAADGTLLEGPATRGLAPVSD